MRGSRGMGAIDPSKEPRLIKKRDGNQPVALYKEGGAVGKNWIKGAIKKPGALHEQMGIPAGEKIPAKKLAKAAQAPGKLGQRARLAQTLKGFSKGGSTGLYANINARREAGLPPKKPGQEGYPTAKAFKRSAKTAKK